MELPSIKETCRPRQEIMDGKLSLDRYAANLSLVRLGKAPTIYQDPEVFFENTYPTEGLKTTVREVFKRLSGESAGSPVIKLETSLGGGKTHTLIALYHLAKNGSSIKRTERLLEGLKFEPMKVAAVVGTEMSVIPSDEGPCSLLGEIALQIGGEDAYKLVKDVDRARAAPGEGLLRKMFGDERCLVLIDEIAEYLAKASAVPVESSNLAVQTNAFLQELTQVASAMDNVSLVITSLSKDTIFKEQTKDLARTLETQSQRDRAAAALGEAEEVLSRVVLNLTPTHGDEFASVVRHRLFDHVDIPKALEVCRSYHRAYSEPHVQDYLPTHAREQPYIEAFQESFPFHPELIQILRTKTSSISSFNRTRGVLRLLSMLVHHLWKNDIDTAIIHPYHISFDNQAFVDEILSRLDRTEYLPAVTSDLSNRAGAARASVTDRNFSEPYGTWAATTIFLHSLTGIVGGDLKHGANEGEVYLALYRPGDDIKVYERAITDEAEDGGIIKTCFYLYQVGSTLLFKTEPNLNKLEEEAKRSIERSSILDELHDRIRNVFGGRQLFTPVFFANEPARVPDDTDKPKLVITHFNDCITKARASRPPPEVEEMYNKTGTMGQPRIYVNNLLFLVADEEEMHHMEDRARSYLALKKIHDDVVSGVSGLSSLSKAQIDDLKRRRNESELFVKVAILVAYKHVFVPVAADPGAGGRRTLRQLTKRIGDDEARDIIQSSSVEVGHLVEFLRDQDVARKADDKPVGPDFILDKVWPKGQEDLTGDDFKKLFYKSPAVGLHLTQELIKQTMARGVEEDRWNALKGDEFYDKSNRVQFRPDLTVGLRLVLVDSETGMNLRDRFYCPTCGNRRTDCTCPKVCDVCGKPVEHCSCPCPRCGKEKAQCTCGKVEMCPSCHLSRDECVCSNIVRIGKKGMKISRMVEEMTSELEEASVVTVQSLVIRPRDRKALSRLLLSLPQLGRKDYKFDLMAKFDHSHEDGNYMHIAYKGDEDGFKGVRGVFVDYLPKEEYSDRDLRLLLDYSEGEDTSVVMDILSKVAEFTVEALFDLDLVAKKGERQ